MVKIATSTSEAIELVNAMLKGGRVFNGEYFDENCGEAYLDWGISSDVYANVSCKRFADEAARYFQDKGLFVYYQTMGWTKNGRIPEGTPICLRIQTKPKWSGQNLIPFE